MIWLWDCIIYVYTYIVSIYVLVHVNHIQMLSSLQLISWHLLERNCRFTHISPRRGRPNITLQGGAVSQKQHIHGLRFQCSPPRLPSKMININVSWFDCDGFEVPEKNVRLQKYICIYIYIHVYVSVYIYIPYTWIFQTMP